jgi:hypothetical protein
VASDPRISAPFALEAERNHIRRTLSAGQKFNSLLALLGPKLTSNVSLSLLGGLEDWIPVFTQEFGLGQGVQAYRRT